MSRTEYSKVIAPLFKAIDTAGLTEVVKGNIAYQTLLRIMDTGTDLVGDEFAEDTAETVRVFSNPITWGISGDVWLNFCETWMTA